MSKLNLLLNDNYCILSFQHLIVLSIIKYLYDENSKTITRIAID